jgi:hypothetical protein
MPPPPDLMTPLRLVMLVLPVLLAVAPAPAGMERSGCGSVLASSDEEFRASFERFDRMQSPTAAKVCALFLNNAPAL